MPKDVDVIKEKIDVVDFLKSYLTLTPTGKNFKALCPFHQEKTPSFFVSPERKMWHCFGCGLGGDVIKFAMLYEHIEFPEALKFLAEKAGLQIQTLNPSEQREFGILYDVNEAAVKFYRENLLRNQNVLAYLTDRGLKPETMEEFRVGYAPGGDELVRFLVKNRYTVNDAIRAGLAQKNARGLVKDKFYQRIVFPIANQVGKTVAFTGRVVPGAPEANLRDVPKYLNSPETIIFNKSKVLYGFDKSKQAIGETKTVVIVEGQMDLLMAWQSGIKNIVAVSGTGLTEEHLLRLRRFADTVVVSFDKDDAGIKALERSLDYFHNFDFHVKVIDLGKFKDPADACKENPDFMKTAISWAKPALSYLMGIYFGASYQEGDIPARKRILRHILSKIDTVKSAVEKGMWLNECSKLSGIGENDLREEMGNLSVEEIKDSSAAFVSDGNRIDREEELGRKLVAIALTNKAFLDMVKNEQEFLPEKFRKIIGGEMNADDSAILELEASYLSNSLDEKTIKKEFNDLLRKLKILSISETKSSLKKALREAEDSDDEKSVSELLTRFSDESKKLNDLKK